MLADSWRTIGPAAFSEQRVYVALGGPPACRTMGSNVAIGSLG
jgi:hypothetical protein